MSLYKRGGTWWLYLVHQGQRIRRTTRTSDRKRAQRIHDEFRAELWKRKPSSGTFYSALDAWLAAEERDAPDEYRVGKLKRLYPNRPTHDATEDSLTKVLPKNPATFNRYANLINAALKVKRLEPRKVKGGRLRWLTLDEWRRLEEALPAHLLPLARFALYTGLRQYNVTHLQWSEVDLNRGVLWVHPEDAKSSEPIGIPLEKPACEVLKAQVGQDDAWVFPYKGKPIGKIKTAWRKALKRAKIENFTWHGFRHTFASWHVQAGTPLSVLKELGGWKDLRMVLRYAHLAPEHLRPYTGQIEGVLRHKVTPQRRRKAA